MLFHNLYPYIRFAYKGPSSPASAFVKSYDCRLFYILNGTGILVIENKSYTLNTGTFILFPAGTLYQFSNIKDLEIIILNFDYTEDYDFRSESFPPVPTEQFDEQYLLNSPQFEDAPILNVPLVLQNMYSIGASLHTICREMEDKQILFREHISTLFLSILVDAIRYSQNQNTRTSHITKQLLVYVQEHLGDSISAKTVSTIFGYHENHINRLIRQATGLTLHQYVINQRVLLAKNLLVNTDLSIDSIAERVNCKYVCNFSSSFKQATGMPPSTYRSHYKNYI